MAVRRILAAALLLMMPFASTTAQEPVLVPDVSNRSIEIKYSFTGEDLLLFGAMENAGRWKMMMINFNQRNT